MEASIRTVDFDLASMDFLAEMNWLIE